MGLWEQECLSPNSVKQEHSDLVQFMEPCLTMNGNSSSVVNNMTSHCIPTGSSIHHENDRSSSLFDCHFQNNSYLTPLPSMGDPYNHHQTNTSPSECQILETLSSCPTSSVEQHQFHKCELN